MTAAWYQTISREQWKTLLAATLGWTLDAMDFVLYLMALSTISGEWGLDKGMAGLLASVSLLTSAIGGMFFGVVADRIGRTRALMATVLIFSLCSLGSATAQGFWQLLVWRTLLGLGMGGEWTAGAVLVSETWPAEHRGKAIGLMQSGWAIGYLLAAVLAALVLPLLGWRWLFAAGVLPALLVVWVRHAVPEPDIWKARRADEGQLSLGGRFRVIFGPALLGRTLLASALGACVLFAYWGLFSWIPGYLSAKPEEGGVGLDIVTSLGWIVPMQLGAFFGYISFGFLAERWGRRLVVVLFLVSAAVLVPVYGLLAREPWLLMALSPVLGFAGHGYFSVFGALLAELFPTAVRATGQGFTYNVGRGLSALAPYTIGALATPFGIGPALGLTSAFFLAGAVLICFLPDTRGQQLD